MSLWSLAVKSEAQRICVVQDFLRMGGTERHSVHLSIKWREEGGAVRLVTARPGGVLAEVVRQKGIDWVSSQPVDLKLNVFFPRAVKEIRAFGPDRVVLMGRVANEMGARIKAALPEIELIGTVRTGRMFTQRYIKGLRAADEIWVNSAYARERVEALGIAAGRIVEQANEAMVALSDKERKRERQRLRRKLGVSEGKRVLIQVGAFRPGKRHADLLGVFAEITRNRADLELWLVGHGPLMRKVKAWVARAGLSDRVRFWGVQLDVKPFYYAADLAVTASQEESNSNFVLEARRAGLPIVAVRSGGTAQALDGVHWVNDPVALQHAIGEVLA